MKNIIHSHECVGDWDEAVVSVVDPSTHTRKKFRIRWRGGSEVPNFWWNHPHGFMCPQAISKEEVCEA